MVGITIKGVYRKIKLGNFPNISVNYARKNSDFKGTNC